MATSAEIVDESVTQRAATTGLHDFHEPLARLWLRNGRSGPYGGSMRTWLAAVAAVVLTAGGGVPGFGAVAYAEPVTPEAPIVTAPPERPLGDSETIYFDDPHIVDPYPMLIDSWSRLGDNTIRVYFTSGTPECYGVHAIVHENVDSVAVELRGGTVPEALNRACILIGVMGALDIPLSSPLGARQVLSVEGPRDQPSAADGAALPAAPATSAPALPAN